MRFETRLERVKEKIKEEEFLQCKGLGNEVPFWIFDYPPEKELLMRDTIEQLKKSLTNHSIDVKEIDLYELSLELIDKKVSLDSIIKREKKKGSEDILKKLSILVKPELLKNRIQDELKTDECKVIFLTGIGKVWPLVRSHNILNNLQVVTENIPLIVFYPGEYSGYDLSLFGKFKDTNYYRAFRLIHYDEGGANA